MGKNGVEEDRRCRWRRLNKKDYDETIQEKKMTRPAKLS